MIPNFYMLVGLPGSGKSYHAEQLAAEKDCVIHSSDAIREEILNDVSDQQHNADVFSVLHKRVKEDLLAGKNVIYDATNISYKRRKAFLDELKNIPCYKYCQFIATPYEVCLEQNNSRDRKVPEEVIDRMYRQIDVPYYFEGWDNINVIYLRPSYRKAYGEAGQFIFDTCDFNQENPHHTATLGDHCRFAYEYIANNHDLSYWHWSLVAKAALIHDNGKPYCKVFIDSKGNICSVAHYYNHEHVGAYNAMFYDCEEKIEGQLFIAFLVRWHMQMYFIDKQQGLAAKYLKLFDSELYTLLEALHKADKEAH